MPCCRTTLSHAAAAGDTLNPEYANRRRGQVWCLDTNHGLAWDGYTGSRPRPRPKWLRKDVPSRPMTGSGDRAHAKGGHDAILQPTHASYCRLDLHTRTL